MACNPCRRRGRTGADRIPRRQARGLLVRNLGRALGDAHGPGSPRPRCLPRLRGHIAGVSGLGNRRCAHRCLLRVGGRARIPGDDHGLARDEPDRLALLAGARLPPHLPSALSFDSLVELDRPRVPLLLGARLVVVDLDENAVVLAPPPPADPIADVAAAVRDALRFPLGGEPLEALVSRGARATVVVEPPALPVPGSPSDPRRVAIAATMTELDRAGAPFERQTLLVAGGLTRRPGHRELELLVPPEFARRFHGRVEVHDVEHPDLVELGHARVHPALVQTDLVVSVTAAETVVNGGPGALLAAAGPEAARAAGALSLLETAGSEGWKLAVELERELARRVPVTGVSLTLNTPALGGVLQGYPYDREAVDRIANFPLRGLFGLLPGPLRRGVLRRLPNELSAFAVFAGPPSVAHAEALLLGVESRSAELAEPLDAICIGVPHTTPHLPREAPNPALAAYLGLGLALRLWRDAFPLVEGGTAILL